LIPALAVGGGQWRTVDNLLPEELARVDLRESSPRHNEIPYVLAERYPFTAPYTAEKMAYRAMEFTQLSPLV
jgi:hypothetical protein